MITRSQRIRLGLFVIIAVSVLVVSLIIVVAPKLLEKRDIYYIAFEDVSVTGLQEGSAVKYQGLQVGYVSKIYIDKENITRVILRINLDQGVPIREDTKAEINFLGITGLKLIELRAGSNESAPLPPGSFIQTGRSLTDEITGKAEVLAEKMELVLNNLVLLTGPDNTKRLWTLIDGAGESVDLLNTLVKRNRDLMHNTLKNTEQFTGSLDSLTIGAQGLVKSWQQLAESDTVKRIIGNLAEVTDELKAAELVRLFSEINRTLEQTNSMLRDVEISFAKSRVDLVYSVERLKETTDYLTQFSRLISEDPSVLLRGAKPKDAPDFKLE